MKGTLALWYETHPTSAGETTAEGDESSTGRKVRLGLHVNLWRDLDDHFNFLDVGFLLTNVETLGRVYLFLPAPIQADSLFDLGDSLKDADTLNAVFNEVGSIEREEDDHFIVLTAKGRRRVMHVVDPDRDLAVHSINVPGRPNGTIVALKSAMCARIRECTVSGDESYVRLRVLLRKAAQSLFTTEDHSPGLGLSLTQEVLETTEFRLNERRSVPPAIRDRATTGRFDLRSVHYFLIRDRNHQLGSQHQNFRKVRYLEKEIWTEYLAVGQGPDWKQPKGGMTIYQWREKAQEESLDDFIAYASFRIARAKLPAYLMAAIAIGGLGGAILNIALAGITQAVASAGRTSPGTIWSNVIAGALLCIPMILLLAYPRITRRRP